MNKFGRILWGLVLIGIGVIVGLNALEITDIDIFFDGWWTLFIIVPAFIGFFKDENKSGNIISILIGIILLLACNDVISFEIIFKMIFPIVLILFGLSFIFKSNVSNNTKVTKVKKSKNYTHYAIFGMLDLDLTTDKFKGCSLNAIFGGIKCDLSNIKIKEDTIVNINSIFGGVDLLVPDNVDVKVNSTPIFGGVSDDRKVKAKNNKPTLYINAVCVFGGIDII